MWEMLGGIGSSLLGGLFGKSGQSKANALQMELADKQMNFQQSMSNTAYQRQAEDMQKAGINPIMAGVQGGASTPSGAMAQVENENAPMASALSDVGNKLFSSALQKEQVKNAKLENNRLGEQIKQLQISNAKDGLTLPVYQEGGSLLNHGVQKIKQIFGVGGPPGSSGKLADQAGDMVLDVINANEGAENAGGNGAINIPSTAKDVVRVISPPNSEANQWAGGKKSFLQSWNDAQSRARDENRATAARAMTPMDVHNAGKRLLEKRHQEVLKQRVKEGKYFIWQ